MGFMMTAKIIYVRLFIRRNFFKIDDKWDADERTFEIFKYENH